MDILKKVNGTIKKYSMLSPGDSVLIGLSGGPDSVCLTIILDKLRPNFNLSLSAVYVNHGLRPEESKREESFCRDLCKGLDIRFYSESVNVREYMKDHRVNNLQEAARELRHDVFRRHALLLKAQRIALGHNADDQAETILMRLLRGTGRRGLTGIPPVRGKIIRPLIEVQRSEIEAFLAAQQPPVRYMVDSSNLKTDYLRNWIRLNLIPQLKRLNPSLIETLNRSAVVLSEEDLYLETMVTKTMLRLVSKRDEGLVELFLVPLEGLERPIMRRVLIRAMGEVIDPREIEFIHIEDVMRLIREGKSGDMISLPKGLKAIKKYSTLLLTTKRDVEVLPRLLDVPGEVYLGEINATIRASVSSTVEHDGDGKGRAVFDLDRVSCPLRIRKRREGDYFYPAGMGDKRKKLQDFFVDEKVPRHERDSIPVVTSGEEIIWVAGYRMDGRFKAGRGTKRFLVLEFIRDA
jgi:tRNA(Ile)-lysidine synthase